MKVQILFDHPDSYREWKAWPSKEKGFLRIVSSYNAAPPSRPTEEHRYELIVPESQVRIVEL